MTKELEDRLFADLTRLKEITVSGNMIEEAFPETRIEGNLIFSAYDKLVDYALRNNIEFEINKQYDTVTLRLKDNDKKRNRKKIR